MPSIAGLFGPNGRLRFTENGNLATSDMDCRSCHCCPGGCKFNWESRILDYTYLQINPVQSQCPDGRYALFQATRPFYNEWPTAKCCFCPEYNVYFYDSNCNPVFSHVAGGAGTAFGFCYGTCGWWDGNDQTGGPLLDGQCRGLFDQDIDIWDGRGAQTVQGTYFSCGVCQGWITARYYYSTTIYADVQFYVDNPCVDEEDQEPYEPKPDPLPI